jgi:hypothetical protein
MYGKGCPVELFIDAIAQVNGDGGVAQGIYREGCRPVHCTPGDWKYKLRLFRQGMASLCSQTYNPFQLLAHKWLVYNGK